MENTVGVSTRTSRALLVHLTTALPFLILSQYVHAQPYEIFRTPILNGARVDWCPLPGRDCGQPAADHYYRQSGYAMARNWQVDYWLRRTFVMGTQTFCEGSSTVRCNGFRYITCRRGVIIWLPSDRSNGG